MTGRIVVVAGTTTGVGKTVTTAALAVRARREGSVTVVKPVQTGIGPDYPDERADVDVVHALAGCATQEYTCLPDPLAPDTAARIRGLPLPGVSEYADRIRVLAEFEQQVIVEGAGGVLVRLDHDGGTLLDLAAELAATHTVEVVLVVSPGLGTLNHTELTLAALHARGLTCRGLVIGAWPSEPGLAERCNLDDLPRVTGLPVLARIPQGAGALPAAAFGDAVDGWFATS